MTQLRTEADRLPSPCARSIWVTDRRWSPRLGLGHGFASEPGTASKPTSGRGFEAVPRLGLVRETDGRTAASCVGALHKTDVRLVACRARCAPSCCNANSAAQQDLHHDGHLFTGRRSEHSRSTWAIRHHASDQELGPTAAVCCCNSSESARQETLKVDLTRGGAKGTRTPNPLLAKQVRYQLRHGPVSLFA
jgi:hypothetical protein